LSINIFTTDSSITGVNSRFIFAQVLLDCLLRLKSTQADRKELINHFKQQYHGGSVELSNVHKFSEDYKSEEALWWYTRESFFYKTLDTALRNQNIHIIFLLRKCIGDIQHQLKDHQVKHPLRVYRGQMIFNDDLETLKNCQSQFVSVNSFLSTSNDRQEELLFLNAANDMNNLNPVLFEINADPTMASEKPFADISEVRGIGGESNILFTVGSIFRLNNVGYDRDDQVWIIRMTLYSEKKHDLKQLMIHMKRRFDIREPTLRTLGRVLWDMGKMDLAEQYYTRFLKKLEPRDPLLRSMYEDLADLTSQMGDDDKSFQWYTKLISLENENDANCIGKFIKRDFTIMKLTSHRKMNTPL
jgi:tetratricopeptide (TPR) repeat protein